MKIHKIFTALTLGLAMVFASCEGPVGAIYEGDGKGVSFASSSMIKGVTAADSGIIRVPVYRAGKVGESSVQIELDSADYGARYTFYLERDEVVFADGENVAYAEFSFDFDDVAYGKEYYLRLKVPLNRDLSPSGIGTIEINLEREFATKPLEGKGTLVSALFERTFEFEVEKATEANVYVFKEIFAKDYDLILVLNDDESKMISFGPYQSGYVDSEAGMVWFQGLTYEKSGNDLNIKCHYYAPGVGSFGEFDEVFTLPEVETPPSDKI